MNKSSPGPADDLRRRAEALLHKDPAALQRDDLHSISDLAQELAIHQAELELQNEELRNTQSALQKARERFRVLFQSAPVGYVVLDQSGIIRQTNATWCRLLKRDGEDFTGTPFSSTVWPEDVPLFLARFRAFFRNPKEKQITLRLQRADNEPFAARIETSKGTLPPATGQTGERTELMVTVTDISDLQQAREELEQRNRDQEAARQRLDHIYHVLLGIRNVNQLIVAEDDPAALIRRACTNLTETMGYHNAWIALLDKRGEAVTDFAQSALGKPGKALQERLRRGLFPSCLQQVLADPGLKIFEHPAQQCPDCPLSPTYASRAGFSRRLCHGGQDFGVLTVSVPLAYAHDDEEQALFVEVAGDLAFALHKIADAARREEERRRLAFVIEGSRLGTWEWNVQTNHTVFSDKWAEMLGYTLAELGPCQYATWEHMVHPADRPAARAALERCITGSTPYYEFEFRMRHKQGHWVWILDRGAVMTRDAAGRPLLMFGTHSDITERKQAEAELRLQAMVLDQIQDHVTITDLEGNITFVNQADTKSLNRSKAEIVGASINIFGEDPTAGATQQEILERTLADGAWRGEVVNYTAGGDPILMDCRTQVVYDDSGTPLCLCGISTDITERKRAENALKESEARFRQIYEHIAVGVARVNLDFCIEQANEAYCRMLGYSEQELPGRTLQQITDPEVLEKNIQLQRQLVAGEIDHFRMEKRFLHKDGHTIHGLLDACLIRDADGTPAYCLGSVVDLSELRAAEAELRQSLEEKSQLLRELYHRTKNNMQVIISLLRLRSSSEDDPKVQELVRDTTTRIQSMALVHEMLYRAQHLSRISLDQYIKDLATLLMKTYDIAPEHIGLQLDLEPIPVLIDTAVPCGMLVNELVTNALKHAFPKGRRGTIRINLHHIPDTERISLVVADNGVGPPPGFDLHSATTLGMQLSVSIVEHQLQGTIAFDPDTGLTCRIEFAISQYRERI